MNGDRFARREPLAIHDLNHYVSTRGLRQDTDGSTSELNMAEARERVAEESAYQERVLGTIFGNDKEEDRRTAFLDSIDDSQEIILSTQTEPVRTSFKPLAKSCDTIYALVSSRKLYSTGKSSDDDDKLKFSLIEFSAESVREFVGLVDGSVETVSSDAVVECCKIAHYLQASTILDRMVKILDGAVDTKNCLSICHLADQLNLPRLFERALCRLMDSMRRMEDMDVWSDLSPELQERILQVKMAMESAALTDSRNRLYFSSIEEYMALFAETIQYHSERLADAKQRQEELRRQFLVRSHGWQDAQVKIERQEKRLNKMKTIMKQQKELFK